MGNICNGNHEREDHKDTTDPFNKNCPICQFTLRKLFNIDLVLGDYLLTQAHTDAIKDRCCLSWFNSNTWSTAQSFVITLKTSPPSWTPLLPTEVPPRRSRKTFSREYQSKLPL